MADKNQKYQLSKTRLAGFKEILYHLRSSLIHSYNKIRKETIADCGPSPESTIQFLLLFCHKANMH